MPDTVRVEVYKQLGASQNPASDTLLATDTTIVSGGWDVGNVDISGWALGKHKIYAIGYDLAGNVSLATGTIEVQKGLEGIILDDWDDLNLTSNRDSFASRAFAGSEPAGNNTKFLLSRPVWTVGGTPGSVSVDSSGRLKFTNATSSPRAQVPFSVNMTNAPGKYCFEGRSFFSSNINKPILWQISPETGGAYTNNYQVEIRHDNNIYVKRKVSGSVTSLGTYSWTTIKGSWFTWKVERYKGFSGVTDGTIKVYINGVLKGTVVDTNHYSFSEMKLGTFTAMSTSEYILTDWIRVWVE